MRQHHPLENPSLAPYGFVFPHWQERLEFKPKADPYWINEERIIARVWDRCNRANAPRPLPVEMIIHEILPGLASANRITDGDLWHNGLPYLTRDILVLSTVVQWFGTNVGRCFLETNISHHSIPGFHSEREFLIKFAQEMQRKDMVVFFTHVHTSLCDAVHSFRGGCYYGNDKVSSRDRIVIDGLMRWLGRKAGRTFIAEYSARKKNAWNTACERQKKAWEEKKMLKVQAGP